MFGHFGYGYVVIDGDGKLRGANLRQQQVTSLLAEIADDVETAGEFATRTKLIDVISGRPGFNLSKTLTQPMIATLQIELQLPDGYHVYGSAAANPEPTVLKVAYAEGVKVGDYVIKNAKGPADGAQQVSGPVHIDVPIEIAQGTPVGQYFAHGTLRFMACNADGCLPAMELRWAAKIPAL